MAMGRTLAFAVLMSGGLGGVAGPALAQSCTRAGVDVTCDDGRRGVLGGDYDRVGRRLALEPDLAASERHHRQQVVGRGRARRVHRPRQGRGADGEPERSDPGAVPGARWAAVLLLRAPGRPRIAVGAMREETKFAFDRKVIWGVQPLAKKHFA